MVDRDAFCPINSTDNCIIVPRKARSEDLQGVLLGVAFDIRFKQLIPSNNI